MNYVPVVEVVDGLASGRLRRGRLANLVEKQQPEFVFAGLVVLGQHLQSLGDPAVAESLKNSLRRQASTLPPPLAEHVLRVGAAALTLCDSGITHRAIERMNQAVFSEVQRNKVTLALINAAADTVAEMSIVFDLATEQQSLLTFKKTMYLGSHPHVPEQITDVEIQFNVDGLALRRDGIAVSMVFWSAVAELSADDRDTVSKRVTVARLLLLGRLSFLAKKETTVSYLIVRDESGEWIFGVPGMSSIELYSRLGPLQTFVTPLRRPASFEPPQAVAEIVPAATNSIDPEARLIRLASMRDRGLITDTEYAERRLAILGEL